MIIRKYLVDNINEALFRIKHELGDDAYIISQRMVRQPGVKGFFSGKKLEVTVGLMNRESALENKYITNEAKAGVLNSASDYSNKEIENIQSVGEVSKQINGNYVQNAYTKQDNSQSMSYYNKLFEEKQKIFNPEAQNSLSNRMSEEIQNPYKPNMDRISKEGLPIENNNNVQSSIMDLNSSAINQQIFRNSFGENKVNNDGQKFSEMMGNNSQTFKPSNENTLAIKQEEGLAIVNQIENSIFKQYELQNQNTENLKQEIKEIKNIVKGIANGSNGVSFNCLDEILIEQDICKELYDQIKSNCTLTPEELMDKNAVRKYLRGVFSNIIKIDNSDNYSKLIAVGPTGSGKTTTVAKLAGMLSLNLNKKVGLVTIDTFRVGAVEQLKMYADIMNIPYKSVTTLNDIKIVFESMRSCDVVLIDTVGRSNKNIIQLNELNMFIQSIPSDQISLVVSAGMKQQDIDLFINSFKGIKFRNVIVTKLDETNSFGVFANICYKTALPISFVTIGQEVPLDIKKTDKKEILDMILGEEDM